MKNHSHITDKILLYKEDSKHFGELTYEILFPIAEAILYDAQQWEMGQSHTRYN